MTNTTSRSFNVQFALIIAISMLATASAVELDAIVDNVSGAEVDGFAVGRLLNSGDTVATWNLQTSVSQTDFSNDSVTGGNQGVQYVMLNEVKGSDDANLITFNVNPLSDESEVGISIAQSPYFDQQFTWNGGNFERAQFAVFWTGGGVASVLDPDDQLSGLANGSTFSSGTNIVFSNDRILNESDSWKIDLPTGVESVSLRWSSAEPVDNSDLTREWVSFDITMTVPEPTTGALCSMALLSLGFLRRRRR